ncbi:MAG: alpha/beta hydrolase [Bacteroidetes bacterium]|nr:alpha/beta hydrolase [Bacteroidota bacterium]
MNNRHYFFLPLIVLLLSSCTRNRQDAETQQRDKPLIDNQGVLIDYTDSQTGDTTLLFAHGWGINKTYWSQQEAFFKNRYRVVTIDLPGFGQSGNNRKSWTAEDYAADIQSVLTKLDLKNVVLIGHSMSGAIVVETAITDPSRIIGIVGVDNLKDTGLVLSPEEEREWKKFYAAARQNFKKTVSADIHQLFAASTDSIVKARVTNDLLNSDTTMAVDCLENLDMYPFAAKLKLLTKPLYLINSSATRTDTIAFQRNHIDYHLLDMGPTGHYPMMEDEKKFNLLLQKAISGMQKRNANHQP